MDSLEYAHGYHAGLQTAINLIRGEKRLWRETSQPGPELDNLIHRLTHLTSVLTRWQEETANTYIARVTQNMPVEPQIAARI